MKKAKKLFGLLMASLMVVSLAACSAAPSSSSSTASTADSSESSAPESSEEASSEATGGDLDGKTITFTMQKYGSDPSAQDNALKEITARFKEETGITVEYSLIDWGQALTKLTLASTGGEAPDVADVFFTASIVQMGNGQYGPMDITEIYEELGGDDAYFSAAIEEVKHNGGVYGIPWRMDTRGMLYNTAHFEEAGITEIPTTYDELIEVAKQLTVTDENGNITRSGAVLPVSGTRLDQGWFGLLAGHEGSIMNEGYTEFTFNSQAGLDSLQFMYDLVNVHKVCTTAILDPSFDSSTEFLAEKASIILGSNADIRTTAEAQAPQMVENLAMAPMPSLTGEGVSSIAFAAPISIMQTTEEYEASAEWVKYFCSPEVQLEFCSAVNLINSNIEVMSQPYYTDDPLMVAMTEQASRAIQGDPQISTWSQIDAFPDGPINSMCTNVMAGNDIQGELDACLSEALEIFEDAQ